jgi:hypothetical protein
LAEALDISMTLLKSKYGPFSQVDTLHLVFS